MNNFMKGFHSGILVRVFGFLRFILPPALALVVMASGLAVSPVTAQGEPLVQDLSGVIIGPGDIGVYQLSNLQAGDTLTAYMRTTSGNLDPLLMLIAADVDLPQTIGDYQVATQEIVAANGDIAAEVAKLRDSFTLAWDDDSGAGYAAALEYEITADGDYMLLAGASLSTLGRNTSGNYDLLVGINAPEVLDGAADTTGQVIAVADNTLLPRKGAIEEVVGPLNGPSPISQTLAPIPSDTTVYAYVETTLPDFRPALILRDFGGKPLTAGNISQSDSVAQLEYTLTEGGSGYVLEIQGRDGVTPGEDDTYRLVVGIGAPEVLTGTAEATGDALIKQPIVVQTGMRLNRISGVDSRDESFTMLGSVRMDWTDPRYAFSPDECNCTVKVFTGEDFRNFLSEVGSRWPDFSFFNQLGPRSSQTKAVAVWSDGRARYVEDFSVTIQADFDFQQFPFDTQNFPIYMDMLFAEDSYVQEVLSDYSGISSEHGEDEFVIDGFTTTISTETGGSTGSAISRFTFAFSAPRHLDYYIFQIFLPILLIALISWFTFFLRDYSRRIEAAAANVLLFIAFSFSLSDNYPRLGYLTFLDAIMLVSFIINAVVILYNVYLKQLEAHGNGEQAEKIDHYLDWVYPLGYLVAVGFVIWIYFGRGA